MYNYVCMRVLLCIQVMMVIVQYSEVLHPLFLVLATVFISSCCCEAW